MVIDRGRTRLESFEADGEQFAGRRELRVVCLVVGLVVAEDVGRDVGLVVARLVVKGVMTGAVRSCLDVKRLVVVDMRGLA